MATSASRMSSSLCPEPGRGGYDPDARTEDDFAPGDRNRSSEAVEQSLREADSLVLGDLLEQERKLVSAESRHRVARAHNTAESLRDLLQQLIARVVAETVVYLLEAVEIDQQDRE